MSVAFSNTTRRQIGKRSRLCSELHDLAVQLGPGRQLPTVPELCLKFGVARVTLDGAFAQLERQRVLVRRHRQGIYVSPRFGQKTIGIVFGGDIFGVKFSPFWGLLLKAVREQTAGRTGLRTQAYMDISGGHDGLAGHEQLVEDLESRRLHGMLLFAASSSEEVRQLDGFGVPLVAPHEPGRPETDRDLLPTVRSAARELATRGCRRVACLQGDADAAPLLEQELRQAGVADAEVLDWSLRTWNSRLAGLTTRESFGRKLMAQMIADAARTPLPDAIASLQDDMMTRGAITAMLQAGLRPGRDLTIVARTNKGSPVLESYAEDIIPLELDPAAIVRKALARLERRMDAAPSAPIGGAAENSVENRERGDETGQGPVFEGGLSPSPAEENDMPDN